MKRNNYLSWDQYFMGLAKLAAMRSKDPNTQVGCCIVGENKKVIGIGYNGFPRGCSDNDFPWDKEGDFLNTKYAFVCHSEINAILNATNYRDLRGSTMYVSLFPCNECAKAIIQSGVFKVYYLDDTYHDRDFTIAARKMFDASGVEYIKLDPEVESITIDFKRNDD